MRPGPWHRLGVVLPERPNTLETALAASGLTWTVEQHPIALIGGEAPLEGWRANVRSDTGALLGIVSDDYRVVQNEQAFAFLVNLVGSELHFETAGSLSGGRQVFVTAELPDWIEVGGDQVRRYVVVSAGHDGGWAVRAAVTPIRVVCNNTLRAALEGAAGVYRVRHLGEPTRQLQRGARRARAHRQLLRRSSPPSATPRAGADQRPCPCSGCSSGSTPTARTSAAAPA